MKKDKVQLLQGIAAGKIDPKEAFRKKKLEWRIGYDGIPAQYRIDGKPATKEEYDAELNRQGCTGFDIRYVNDDGTEFIPPGSPLSSEADPDYDI